MNDETESPAEGGAGASRSERFAREVGDRCARRARGEGYRDKGFWAGVGVMGLVGWSVILPAVLGGFLGIWIDRQLGLTRTFGGLLAVGGLALGVWNAWRMVRKVFDAPDAEDGGACGPGEEDPGAGRTRKDPE